MIIKHPRAQASLYEDQHQNVIGQKWPSITIGDQTVNSFVQILDNFL